jgi:hypothetical protein
MRGRRLRRLAAAVTVLLCSGFIGIEIANAEVRIRNDPGGLIAGHMQEFTTIRDSGQPVVIDGPCYSACTLVLGMIPHERLCVTPRARLGFHAAWAYAPDGSRVASQEGTASLWSIYPMPVRRWISRNGGLSPKTIVLSGRELASMYRACR